MAILLVLAACAVLGSVCSAPTEMTIDPNYPPTWMGKCGEKEEEIAMFKEKMATMQKCYENVFNSTTGLPKELMEEANSSETDQDPCTALTTYVNCVHDFLSDLEHCFDDDHQNDMNTTISASKAMFTEICEGLAREASQNATTSPSDVECMQGKDQEMFACFEERAQETTLAEMMPYDNMAASLLDMTYDENTCRTLHDVWRCVGDVFETCPNNTITPIIHNGMLQFYETTPCKQMLTTQDPASITTGFTFF